MWRIQHSHISHSLHQRITSTYVENTPLKGIENFIGGDHLHIRGEYKVIRIFGNLSIGSPPHTWRIHNVPLLHVPSLGITSTYVENTASFAQSRKWLEDHLHIRGEYSLAQPSSLVRLGSPPHTWRILRKPWLVYS